MKAALAALVRRLLGRAGERPASDAVIGLGERAEAAALRARLIDPPLPADWSAS